MIKKRISIYMLLSLSCALAVNFAKAADLESNQIITTNQTIINFDGKYERRNFTTSSGVKLYDENLTIADPGGVWELYTHSTKNVCGHAPVEVLEKHGNYLTYIIKRSALGIRGCEDVIAQMILTTIDGVTGLASVKDPDKIMFVQTTSSR